MDEDEKGKEVGPGMELLGVAAVLCLGVASKASLLLKSVLEGQTLDEVAETRDTEAQEHPLMFLFCLLLFFGWLFLVCKFVLWVSILTGSFFF